MRVKQFERTIYFMILPWIAIICFLVVCSKADNPVEPEPEPIPCDPVPCEVVRYTGTWIITWGNPNDISTPNSGALLQNDKMIWSIVDSVPRSEELVVRVSGNHHIEDTMELLISGSNARLWYRFEVRDINETFWENLK